MKVQLVRMIHCMLMKVMIVKIIFINNNKEKNL